MTQRRLNTGFVVEGHICDTIKGYESLVEKLQFLGSYATFSNFKVLQFDVNLI